MVLGRDLLDHHGRKALQEINDAFKNPSLAQPRDKQELEWPRRRIRRAHVYDARAWFDQTDGILKKVPAFVEAYMEKKVEGNKTYYRANEADDWHTFQDLFREEYGLFDFSFETYNDHRRVAAEAPEMIADITAGLITYTEVLKTHVIGGAKKKKTARLKGIDTDVENILDDFEVALITEEGCLTADTAGRYRTHVENALIDEPKRAMVEEPWVVDVDLLSKQKGRKDQKTLALIAYYNFMKARQYKLATANTQGHAPPLTNTAILANDETAMEIDEQVNGEEDMTKKRSASSDGDIDHEETDTTTTTSPSSTSSVSSGPSSKRARVVPIIINQDRAPLPEAIGDEELAYRSAPWI